MVSARQKTKAADKRAPAKPVIRAAGRQISHRQTTHRQARLRQVRHRSGCRGPSALRNSVAGARVCDPRGDCTPSRRNRPRRLEQACRIAQFDRVSSGKNAGFAWLCAPGKGEQALSHRPASLCARRKLSRRDRDGECRNADPGRICRAKPVKARTSRCAWAMRSSSSRAPLVPAPSS